LVESSELQAESRVKKLRRRSRQCFICTMFGCASKWLLDAIIDHCLSHLI
jgi:hypothetical protein